MSAKRTTTTSADIFPYLVLFCQPDSRLLARRWHKAASTAMETAQHPRGLRLRGAANGALTGPRRSHSRNKQWVAPENGPRSNVNNTSNNSDGERRERGAHRGGRGARGASRGIRRFPNVSLHVKRSPAMLGDEIGASDSETAGPAVGDSDMEDATGPEEPELESQEEREKFYQEVWYFSDPVRRTTVLINLWQLVKAREVERKKAIAEGTMDDPLVPKRLEDAITMVGTCMDMCPRFERYRRERENNLFEWETVYAFLYINVNVNLR